MKYSRAVGSRFEALGVLGSKSWRKQTLIFFQKKWGSVFFNFLIRALLRPQIAIRCCATILCVWKIYFWENDKILITLAIHVPFWSLRYLWKRLCNGIQDFRLSHTFIHSFSHGAIYFYTCLFGSCTGTAPAQLELVCLFGNLNKTHLSLLKVGLYLDLCQVNSYQSRSWWSVNQDNLMSVFITDYVRKA